MDLKFMKKYMSRVSISVFSFFFSHKEEWYLKVKSGSKNKFIMENYTPPIFNNFKTLASRPLIKYYGDQDQTFSQLNPDLAASGK